ncbi:AGAP004221-PA-like protein [Anopheles sinensis]|uniref:AGAP004221-PA-like protein n=1 Tax=Anopheles sinensis TaxID=74873 RepID=A0A084VLC8_ANOSI|nr:AGAP004221-PA-like protein [Anopheles sinensis]
MSAPELSWHVFRDIGVHKLRLGQVTGAIDSFNQASPGSGEEEPLQVWKAKALLANCDPQGTLQATGKALKYPATLLHCRALYDVGELERHLLASCNGKRRQQPDAGPRQRAFAAEVDLGLTTFEYTLGERAGKSLLEYRHRFRQIAIEQEQQRQKVDGRPRWKVLAEAGECDTESVLAMGHKEAPLLEQARRRKNMKILGQVHLGCGWEDWLFIEQLRSAGRFGAIVNLHQTKESSAQMCSLVEECYEKVTTRVKQAQACFPLYSQRHGRFGPRSNLRRERFEIDQLLKYRYRAYRAVYNQLDRLTELRKEAKVGELLRFAGEVLHGFYKTTTVRVLPEKGQMVREICNLVGLAVLDRLRIPPLLMDEPADRRLLLLFAIPPPKEPDVVVPVFGDISTYRDPTEPDHGYLRYKNKIAEVERRYRQAEYPIERCFRDYQMARLHLANGWLDDVKVMGHRMIDEAIGCGSHLWQLIGQLTIARAFCAQQNLEQLAVWLRAAGELVAHRLPDERLAFFIELSQRLNRDLLMKKQVAAGDRTLSVELDHTVLA